MTNLSLAHLPQAWPLPSQPLPIVCIGAGAIVEVAHLPAYQRLGLPVAGLHDLDGARARTLAERFAVPRVYDTLAEAARASSVVFDLAVPARAVPEILEALPDDAAVLIQKPMGETLEQARRVLEICESKRLTAAVNFQLRFAPSMLALKALLGSGWLGRVTDVEVRVNVHTPWDAWPFLKGIPRHEVLYHSIHYLDLVRWFLGEPSGVLCRALRHPALPGYSDTRSATLLDYGDEARVLISANHAHAYGNRHQVSELRVEGTSGAAVARIGVNLDYPRGEPDTLEVCQKGGSWQPIELRGSWFGEAFEGPISNLERYVAGEDPELVTRVADAIRTMALVEACYTSNSQKAPAPPDTGPGRRS